MDRFFPLHRPPDTSSHIGPCIRTLFQVSKTDSIFLLLISGLHTILLHYKPRVHLSCWNRHRLLSLGVLTTIPPPNKFLSTRPYLTSSPRPPPTLTQFFFLIVFCKTIVSTLSILTKSNSLYLPFLPLKISLSQDITGPHH